MAASSKSSQKAKNVVICLLTLWSLISLIIIVVWATSPDWKGAAQCNAELRDAKEKLVGSRSMWEQNKKALEEKVEKERNEVERRAAEILLLLGHLNATNTSLVDCRQEVVSDRKSQLSQMFSRWRKLIV
uniref:Uncharacterized protein n=1 Tax=Echeneis naucrates TaxID=173247 RepID=A0A665U6N6_ECHNA